MVIQNGKEDYIRRHGEEAYEEKKEASKKLYWADPERNRGMSQEWRERNPDQVKKNGQEQCRKGGKYYESYAEYSRTGLRRERNSVRGKHQNQYRPYKKIIAPDSQYHHQWVPGTAAYSGLALVEKDQHMHGFIDVIRMLEGEITLFTEKEISAIPCPC